MIAQCRICGATATSWDVLKVHEREAHPPVSQEGVLPAPYVRPDPWVTQAQRCTRCEAIVSDLAWAGHQLKHLQDDRDRAASTEAEGARRMEEEWLRTQITTTNFTTTNSGPSGRRSDMAAAWAQTTPFDLGTFFRSGDPDPAPAPESVQERQEPRHEQDVAPSTGEKKRRIKMPEGHGR